MLCYYSDSIVPEMNNYITYNNMSSLLLTGNLGMSYVEIKKKLFGMDLSEIIMILMLK
jgi:hypothetical protein